MKKIFMLSVLVLVLSVVNSPVCSEEIAKEGTGTAKSYYSSSLQMLSMERERVQINYEGFGVIASDDGKGIFHNASQHVLGGMHVFKGAIEDSGFIVTTLTNGDKTFATYKGSGKMGKPTIVKGSYTYVGGTGKVSGIQGGGEFTRYTLQPPAKGQSNSFSTTKNHWKIVESKE